MQVRSVIDSIMDEAGKDKPLLCYALRSLLIDMQGRGNCDPMMNETCSEGSGRWRLTPYSPVGGYAGKKVLLNPTTNEKRSKTRRLLVGRKC